jgi:hypothetical protein
MQDRAIVKPRFAAFNGVGVAMRGTAFVVLYVADARVHRTRWVFDRADELALVTSDIHCLLVIDTSRGFPDGTTRAENARRFKSHQSRLRILVTVPLGDALRVILAKAILRTMALVLGDASLHRIASTEEEGVAILRKSMGPDAPSAEELLGDLARLRALVGESMPGTPDPHGGFVRQT